MLLNILKGKKDQNKSKTTKKIIPIRWRKLILGLVLIGVGIGFGAIYMKDNTLMLMGVLAALALASGGYLVKQSIGEGGYAFNVDGKKLTGDENAIVLRASINPDTQKDVPEGVFFETIEREKIPKGARLHYLHNRKRHYYELFNNTKTNQLEPVKLPDKKSFPPGLFQIPAAMQTYKEAIEYSPPTLMQKLAPGMILLGMGIVGLLMLVTGG